MFFFPEGTRSSSGKLQEFKSGAFRLSLQEGVPILPLVIRGTDKLLKKGSPFPKPAKVTLKVLPLQNPQPSEDHEAFSKRMHNLIESEI